jgi:hypothetical protein
MTMRLPLLIRINFGAERILGVAKRLHAMFRDEILWAWFGPEGREAVNRIIWEGRPSYLPGGFIFEGGLLEWEKRAIREPPFPQAGRILLGGAGGGRELVSLCRRGFDVVAFEPSEELYEGARQAVSPFPNSVVVQASYRDLVAAAQEHTGPLASHVLNTSFDAVLFGWASFNYVFTESDRRELLCATRTIAPKAPLLLSLGMLRDAENGKLDGLRPGIRRICKLLAAPSVRSTGDVFLSYTGFIHLASRDEIEAAAGGSGYRILYFRAPAESSPHALLLPQ